MSFTGQLMRGKLDLFMTIIGILYGLLFLWLAAYFKNIASLLSLPAGCVFMWIGIKFLHYALPDE